MNLGVTIIVIIIAILLFISIALLLFRKYLPNLTGVSFDSYTSGVYNIVAVIGLVAAAIWAISNFELLKQQEQANETLKLTENQTKLAQKQYDELLAKISNVEASKIEIHSEIIDYKGYYDKPNHKGMSIKIRLVNLGGTPIKFDLGKGVLKIYEVNADGIKSGYQKIYEPQVISQLARMGDPAGSTPLTDFVLLTSAERTLNYFAVLPANKLYYIVFKTKAQDLQGASKEECDKVNGCSWFVSKYLYLEGDREIKQIEKNKTHPIID
jgi:hypothetical protein